MPASLRLTISGHRECSLRNSISDDIVSYCCERGLTVNIDDKDCSVVLRVHGDKNQVLLMKLKWGGNASVQLEAKN